ncbi:hypothetical protein HG15A2_45250 [Adhaeretor mobilis]|uniref:Uncharacterized protein n=1 Tax=Adhaeretor mobilis TaxID=1930276 RepID=A0A517N231_9BACT|nr:hypothetical protein HG15A2_45250 [Adhaeretor mobilis]
MRKHLNKVICVRDPFLRRSWHVASCVLAMGTEAAGKLVDAVSYLVDQTTLWIALKSTIHIADVVPQY